MRAVAARCTLAAWLALSPALPAGAERLVSSLSSNVVQITSSFTGVELVLFGTVENDGAPPPFPPPRAGEGAGRGSYDLVATVIGPRQNLVTRRKARIAGIWVNAESRTFLDVPSYAAVLSNRPFESIADAPALAREEIGIAYAALPPGVRAGAPAGDPFREAFLRIERERGLYSETTNGVTFLTPTLFRASIFVPAEAQVGSYGVDVKLFADGAVIARSHSAFEIATVGFERFITGSAIDHGILYGFATAAMAMMTGWFASIIFRRD
jgi:uncharacterized protein (TIGR02186 family)